MTPSERRQVVALLRRAARMTELLRHNSVWDAIEWFAPSVSVRDHALREWHRVLPRRTEVGIEHRVMLALLLADAIEAGDLP